MSPRRTRRGTIRENMNEISIDNSLKSTSKAVRSSRRINKSQIVKSSEEESDNPVEISNLTANATATGFLNDTFTNTRNRRRKIQEISINQDNLSSVTVEDSTKSQTKKSKSTKSPKSKKQIKNTKAQTIDTNSFISEDESFNEKNEKNDRQISYATDNLISEDEENPQKTTRSRKKVKSDHQVSFTQKTSNITPEKLNDEKPSKNITPKSNPVNVSLTLHRSTKTPKKSPVNLGSPKTHSRNSLELLNVSRKLTITDSPTSSEQSNSSLQQFSSNVSSTLDESTSKNRKYAMSASSTTKKSISPFKAKPSFSKSPKIMFKTPKSKSSKTSKTSPLKRSRKTSSPVKSRLSPKDNLSLKSKKTSTTPVDSLLKTEEISKKISSVKSDKSPKITLPTKYKESQESNKLDKSLKCDTSLNSKKSPGSSSKSKKSSKSITPTQSKRSSKTFSPLISKKMPKIVLTLKSKKSPLKTSKSPSPSKIKKSPVKTPKNLSISKSNTSPLKTLKSPSPSKLTKSLTTVSPLKTERSSIKLPIRKSIASNDLSKSSSMSPRVVVKKLSTPQLKNPTLISKATQPSVNLVPVDHVTQASVTPNYQKFSLKSNETPKLVKSSIKRQSTIKSVTPARIGKTQMNTSRKPSEVNLSFTSSTPSCLNKNQSILKPTNTSTPRERFMHKSSLVSNRKNVSLNKSNGSILLNKSPISKSKAIKRLDNQIAKDLPLLEDESEPSLNDSSLIHMSDVFDSDNSQKNNTFEISKNSSTSSAKRKSPRGRNTSQRSNKSGTFEIKKDSSAKSTKGKSTKDDTYEVEHPKTPGFQNKSKKRTVDEAELSAEEQKEPKRNCRVHFVSPDLGNQVQSSGINRIGTPGHAIQQKRTPISLSKIRTPVRQSLVNRVESRRSNSISQRKLAVNTSASKRQSISLSDSTLKSRRSNNEAQAVSVNRLSRPKAIVGSEKKLGSKTPVATKIPNFAEIHKKNFAKMESLVDLKKRVEKRHVTNSVTSSTKKTHVQNHESGKKKPTPIDSTNSAYNRFGFKLRKSDAVNIISKKQTGNIDSREKKREDARTALKGVRMNRRFELQMKSRMKNS